MHVTNCLKGVDTDRRYGQLKTNTKVNMWKTHSEDDSERVFDKVGEGPNIFVLICAALKEINAPRDIVFPKRGIAPPRTRNGHN